MRSRFGGSTALEDVDLVGIERCGGLVQDQKGPASKRGPREREPLPLAHGELVSAEELPAQASAIAIGNADREP